MKLTKGIFGGVVGAVTISVVTAGLRAAGVPINFELMLGSLFTLELGFGTWLLGLAMHLALGACFGLLYAALFERCVGRASWSVGVFVAFAHIAFSGVALLAFPVIHPLIPDVLPAPGPMMLSLGWIAFVSFVALHVLFGAIVGGFYGKTHSPLLTERLTLNP